MTIAKYNSKENEKVATASQLENPNLANNVQKEEIGVNESAQQVKMWRQQLQDIIMQMRQVSEWDAVLKITVVKVREKIACDRALIYQFTSPESGKVLAESRTLGWTPTMGEFLPGITFGLDTNQDYIEPITINNVTQIQLTPYQKQLLDKFQIKASLSLPIVADGKVWGLLVVTGCVNPRNWQETEITLLTQVSTELTYRLQNFEFQTQLQLQNQAKQAVSKVMEKILRLSNTDKIFQSTTQEIRQLLKCDRVAVYRFNPDWSGEFVAESVGSGWVKLVGPDIKTVWEDTHLQETQGGRYRHQESFVVNDIYQAGHFSCHLEILEQFEIKAYIIVPVFAAEKLWGLLAAYQNSGTREWLEWESSFLAQVGLQFGIAISHAEYLEQTRLHSEQMMQIAEQEKIFSRIVNRIRQASDVETIFRTTTQDVRQSLRCDRVAVYRFNSDWGGEFVAESVASGWTKVVGPNIKTVIDDTYLQDTKGGRYTRGEHHIVNNIYTAGFAPCHIETLEQFEARAYIIVPIFFGDKLWGLLAAYQNSSSREWQSWEVNFLTQIALQFSLAKSQLDYLEQVQIKSEKIAQIAEQEKSFTKIVNRIRQAVDIDDIFKITTQEVRQLLRSDRVAVYRFNPNWGGEFVAESVGNNWVKLVGNDIKTVWEDTYIQETQGGRYAKGETFVVNDISQAGHSPCHLEILEQFEVKAYVIVPVFCNEQLWGLLAAYQNSGLRDWEQSEVSLLARVGDQLGLALQQTEYLQQLQAKSAQLAEAAAREKAAKELLQQRSIQLLMAVRPALNGDLTVRAPITEDELGTIADAYNNTLQALRQIVLQVQTSSQQVAQTSSDSNASLAGLNNLAKQQSIEITTALGEIQQMLDSTQAVVTSAELVQVAVQQANKTVESGDAAMNLTVQAIQGIRETVAQTSKKIKRLSESSQKISKVVNLISSFATQTNVLALNAAIEATRAGEYGKGFAVVADEVRSLSRQSAAATIEIEKLVQEIQAETGEVAVAMETGIQQVVEGTNFVSETRHNLNAIVSATAEISQLIQQITDATQKQMGQSVLVTNSMKDVAEIAKKTFAESQDIATVFQDLSGMAQDLLTTASKFKVN
ncbi:chemotaxis sensory transducer, Phytochrome sensor [Trichormus variabilis ATCC 29413]|uniref:Chemotaxis sensory transducer, Phytochrome sensor n=2 Tax=Anabaena variabilis TaxID=264691 RepID=Q3M6K3_TRIV2|nr:MULTISPECIES: GAF domain-containing protein [Nostocaceae]ABA23383.1 chemotaxis sensory transducer, Phytochrome sensor [Trichormus variabilis ATCC 29413]MBC1215129.1 GAF domain-containing protein [Trichormus variabilis ARAD]MBC1257961.1 GAF domain-containing protein [Trichormus variabilis V5]MBC1268209.1 GAF domain-containing protein [Trichormus variabilis FSR]MBC1303782.1 GAF domain-containing protein [Trichormus variabilis N2B]